MRCGRAHSRRNRRCRSADRHSGRLGYPSDNQAHHHYQRVEVARDTTTTTQQDQISGAQAQQAQIMAGGNIVLANVGTINNEYSAIGAGHAIQIGSAQPDGEVASGNYGGTLVNNIGQTLYQYQKQDIVTISTKSPPR